MERIKLTEGIRYVPESYFTASEEVRKLVINGCGAGGWKVDLVPDTIYGLSIKEDCNVHDWMYDQGSTEADKDFADDVFLHNMITRINDSFWMLRPLRRIRAREYYLFVRAFGDSAFWKGKDRT